MSAASADTPAVSPPAPGQANHGCLPRGYRLREFVIERVLGDGGFGVVYSALDLRLERRVAIKEYMPSSLARRNTDYSVQMLTSQRHRDAFEVGLRSFINEARMLARFEHPALVKVHQFWQEKGTAYMVMPFYAAPTLRNWVRARREPVSEAWLRTFLLQSMEAVEVLHAESCLHRDIAPDNILVLDERKPLLLDFGAARQVIGDLRKALTVIVKPGFAPLEQYADTVKMKQGPWTDVYALAAVGHFIITGQAPAPAVSRVLADEVVPLRDRAKGRYSASLLGALDAALSVKPERRPRTIAALRDLMLSTQPGEWEPTRLITQPGALPVMQAPLDDTPAALSGDDATTVLMHGAARVPDISPTQLVRETIPAPAPRSLPLAIQADAPRTQSPVTGAQTLLRSAARFADVGTLTQAVRASFAPESRHSRWLGIAGYAIALAVFGGVLFMTSQLVERYVESNVRGGGSATMVIRSATQAKPVESNATVPAPAPASTGNASPIAEAKFTEVTLAPTRIEAPVPQTAAAVAAPAFPAAVSASPAVKPAAREPARATAKPKVTVTTKVAPVAPRETGKAAILLSASPPATADAPNAGRKSRGLDQMVVPLERAAEIAQVAPVELVVAAAEPSAPAAGATVAPLRAISKPEPQFPTAAMKEGVRDGRVLAQMTVNSDGTIGQVEIVEAYPRNLFDREVRRTLSSWRYEAPGQTRQATVEFVFKREE